MSVSTLDDRLQLDAVLSFNHKANYKAYTNEDLELEARAEIMVADSNVLIISADAASQNALGGEKFGAYVRVTGTSVLQLSNVAVQYCGQAGLDRGCITFDATTAAANATGEHFVCLQRAALTVVASQISWRKTWFTLITTAQLSASPSTRAASTTGSYVIQSAVTYAFDAGLLMTQSARAPVLVEGSAFYYSFDRWAAWPSRGLKPPCKNAALVKRHCMHAGAFMMPI